MCTYVDHNCHSWLHCLWIKSALYIYIYKSLWIWCKIEHQKSKLRKNPIPSLCVLREYVIYLNRVFSILNFVSSSMIFITLRKKYILSPFGIVHKWRHGKFCVCWIEKNAFFCLEVSSNFSVLLVCFDTNHLFWSLYTATNNQILL